MHIVEEYFLWCKAHLVGSKYLQQQEVVCGIESVPMFIFMKEHVTWSKNVDFRIFLAGKSMAQSFIDIHI